MLSEQEAEVEIKGYLDEVDEHFYKKYGIRIEDALDHEDQTVITKAIKKIIHLSNNIMVDTFIETLTKDIERVI